MRSRLFLLASVIAALLAFPVGAREVVELAPAPVSHGDKITLADLFPAASGAAADQIVAPAPPPGQVAVLDAGRVQALAARAGLQWDNAPGLLRIQVEAGVGVERPSPNAAHRKAKAMATVSEAVVPSPSRQVLLYARNIPTGDAIAPEDLVWGDAPPSAYLSAPLNDPDSAAGRIARHPLRAGAPVVARDLVGAKVIHRDEVVFVTFQDDGMSLTLQGRAIADASLGEPVQVMNPTSKKIIEAVASGPGHAVVGPQAETLRSTGTAPFRTASNR